MPAVDQRLGDDPDRVREVDDPGVAGPASPDRIGDLEDHRDRPERLREPARADGLLADQPEPRRQRLVAEPGRLPADPELEEHDVGAVDRGVAIGRPDQPARPALLAEHPLGEPADDLEPLGVDVEQGDLVDRDAVRSGG